MTDVPITTMDDERLTITKKLLFLVECKCGNRLETPAGDWSINIVGLVQFRCERCGRVTTAPELWKDEIKQEMGGLLGDWMNITTHTILENPRI